MTSGVVAIEGVMQGAKEVVCYAHGGLCRNRIGAEPDRNRTPEPRVPRVPSPFGAERVGAGWWLWAIRD